MPIFRAAKRRYVLAEDLGEEKRWVFAKHFLDKLEELEACAVPGDAEMAATLAGFEEQVRCVFGLLDAAAAVRVAAAKEAADETARAKRAARAATADGGDEEDEDEDEDEDESDEADGGGAAASARPLPGSGSARRPASAAGYRGGGGGGAAAAASTVDLQAELELMASAMKHSSLHINQQLRDQNSVFEKIDDQTNSNEVSLSSPTSTPAARLSFPSPFLSLCEFSTSSLSLSLSLSLTQEEESTRDCVSLPKSFLVRLSRSP